MAGAKQKDVVPIVLKAKARTDMALGLVLAHKARLLNEVRTGKLQRADITDIGLAKFCSQAGVGENFLNGKLHKHKLKPEIKDFIRNLKKLVAERETGQPRETAEPQDVEANLNQSLERLRDMLHGTRLQLHAKRQLIKALSERSPPKVVTFKSDKSS